MLEAFYAGALRVSELVSMKIEDLKLDMGYVLVHGKGDKERIVPLGKSAQDALAQYLSQSRALLMFGNTSPLLFLGHRGVKLARQRVCQSIKDASPTLRR